MANLRTAPAIIEEPISRTVECESCGKFQTTDYMLQVMLGLSSTGHPEILPIMCDASQHPGISGHWACPTEECYLDVLVACAKEHVIPQLKEQHAAIKEKNVSNGNKV